MVSEDDVSLHRYVRYLRMATWPLTGIPLCICSYWKQAESYHATSFKTYQVEHELGYAWQL
jgi:hypothetical protein